MSTGAVAEEAPTAAYPPDVEVRPSRRNVQPTRLIGAFPVAVMATPCSPLRAVVHTVRTIPPDPCPVPKFALIATPACSDHSARQPVNTEFAAVALISHPLRAAPMTSQSTHVESVRPALIPNPPAASTCNRSTCQE